MSIGQALLDTTATVGIRRADSKNSSTRMQRRKGEKGNGIRIWRKSRVSMIAQIGRVGINSKSWNQFWGSFQEWPWNPFRTWNRPTSDEEASPWWRFILLWQNLQQKLSSKNSSKDSSGKITFRFTACISSLSIGIDVFRRFILLDRFIGPVKNPLFWTGTKGLSGVLLSAVSAVSGEQTGGTCWGGYYIC